MRWTFDQLMSLAMHEHLARSSQSLASPLKWLQLGQQGDSIWGLYPVKNKAALRVKVRLEPLSFSCDCRGAAFPCSHALGLALLWMSEPEVFAPRERPTWLDWPEQAAPRSKGRAEPGRQEALLEGLEALELWLEDLLRGGLEGLRNRPRAAFKQMSDRLVDARALGPAQIVARWPLRLKQEDWLEHVLKEMGSLHLLVQGFRRFESLSPAMQADLHAAVGWTPRLEEGEFTDRWHVLGQQQVQNGKRRAQHIWLRGETGGRYARLERSLYRREDRDTRLLVGTALSGALRFYAGTLPLRAEPVGEGGLEQCGVLSQGESSVQKALTGYARARACSPWLAPYPMTLQEVQAAETGDGWQLLDKEGYGLPLPGNSPYLWHLRALSRRSLSLFGLWDGDVFRPLSFSFGGKQRDMASLRGRR